LELIIERLSFNFIIKQSPIFKGQNPNSNNFVTKQLQTSQPTGNMAPYVSVSVGAKRNFEDVDCLFEPPVKSRRVVDLTPRQQLEEIVKDLVIFKSEEASLSAASRGSTRRCST